MAVKLQTLQTPGLAGGELLYRELVEEMSEGLCISAPDFTFQFANPALERIFGVAPGTLPGRNLLEFISPAELETINRERQSRATGHAGHYQLPITRPDGAQRTLEVHAKAQLDVSGQYCGSIALVTDVTDWLEAQRALERSRIQYQALFENMSDVALYESGGGRQQYTANLPKLLGMTPDEYRGYESRFGDLMHPEDFPACEQAMRDWRAKPDPGMLVLEFRVRHKDGGWRWMRDRMVLLTQDNGQRYTAGIMFDITNRIAAEESQRLAQLQSAELETIKRTTATYAHEVNNPLTGIAANVQMLLESEELYSERKQMLLEIQQAAAKIGSVIRRMQSISHPAYRSYMGRDIIDIDESED